MKKANLHVGWMMAAGVACGGSGTNGGFEVATLALGPTAPQEARDVALALLGGGTVRDVDRSSDDGRERWEVEVVRTSGSIVEVEIGVNDGRVYEVESYTVVESDDLNPGGGVMTLQEALKLARTSVEGRLVRWELEREGRTAWEWEIELEDGNGRRREIDIDARARRIDEVSDDFGRDDDDDDHGDDDGISSIPNTAISREQAEDIALKLLGGRVLDTDFESDDGSAYYDIEVERESGSRVEVEIDALTGKVLEVEAYNADDTDDFDPGEGFVTLQDALAAAKAEVPGQLIHWEFEQDDGGYDYDIVLRTAAGALMEVEVDAVTGLVDDVEPADDDDYDDDLWDDDDWDGDDEDDDDDDADEDDDEDEDDD